MSASTATDLRHMTSNPALVSPRLSQHLRTHSPARSPTSIPSSPTSVHSSSSAIFERDIEPLSPPSPQAHTTLHPPPNAHRIPRSKTTEQLEHSVPSVLDSAAAILASIQNTNTTDVSVLAPAPYPASFAGSGFASPIGSFRSRSPSPTVGGLAAHGRNSLLLSIPQQQQQQQQQQQHQQQQQAPQAQAQAPPAARSPPSIQTTNVSLPAAPAIVTPTSAYYSVADESELGSAVHSADEAEDSAEAEADAVPPTSATTTAAAAAPPPHEETPKTPPPSNPSSLPAAAPAPSSSSVRSHPHSPASPHSPSNPNPNLASKRLSFISYADLLSSAPTSTLSLSSLTSAASTAEPPPHLSAVSASTSPGASAASPASSTSPFGLGSASPSLRGFAISPTIHAGDIFGAGAGAGAGSVRGKRDRDSVVGGLGVGLGVGSDDVGGEWEREGLGRGLAERLDVLYGSA